MKITTLKLFTFVMMLMLFTTLSLTSCGEESTSEAPEEETPEEEMPEEEAEAEYPEIEDDPTKPTLTSIYDSFTYYNFTRVEELSDEFNVDGLDSTKWFSDPQANGWQWLGAGDGLFQEDRVQVKDGCLTIETGAFDAPVAAESYGNTNYYNYYCGIVRTLNTGGVGKYYECKMKMNKTELGGGFWLMAHPDLSRRHEIDIEECVGIVSEDCESYAVDTGWDRIFHCNAIYTKPIDADGVETGDRVTNHVSPLKYNGAEYKNSDCFVIYGFWWQSARSLRFYLNGVYQFTLVPDMDFDVESHVQLSIQVYEWNPVPADGGEVSRVSVEDRTTYYDWVRVWDVAEP